jgi:hypothetical protein
VLSWPGSCACATSLTQQDKRKNKDKRHVGKAFATFCNILKIETWWAVEELSNDEMREGREGKDILRMWGAVSLMSQVRVFRLTLSDTHQPSPKQHASHHPSP